MGPPGAYDDSEFDHGQQSTPLRGGDTIIAYTDGVIESRNQRGQMLRVEGVQSVMATLRPSLGAMAGHSESVLRAVQEYRFGAASDDTLVVEISRPLGDWQASEDDSYAATAARVP